MKRPNIRLIKPGPPLNEYVYCFTALEALQDFTGGIIIPNGRIDLLFCKMPQGAMNVLLMGLETGPKLMPEHRVASFFAISFNPLALEYILQTPMADFVDRGRELPSDFWGFSKADMEDFDAFCDKATRLILSRMPAAPDPRKRQLFRKLFEADGQISINELASESGWSARQINRYFTQQLGIPLKTYGKILRFQAALEHIRAGQLAPEGDFADQSHFIKEIRKLSGVSPKVLFRNENDRFLQFLVYDAP